MFKKHIARYRVLLLAALPPLVLGCSTAGESSSHRAGAQPDRPVTNFHGNEFLTRGPSR